VLIRITNRCTMGCPHCVIDSSGPKGAHMTEETFEEALKFREVIGSRIVVVSGGEPTEHPQFFGLMRKAVATVPDHVCAFVVASNGLFALDDFKYERMCRLVDDSQGFITVQVTNDVKYYPRSLAHIQSRFQRPNWAFVDSLFQLTPCRRTRENNLTATRRAPLCFNLRAHTRIGGLASAVAGLEGLMRACCPSINIDGTVRAGEGDTCHELGDVRSEFETIEEKLVLMRCGACGLRNNLKDYEKELIGENGVEP